jgi:light-harvesting complex I chlorophyll a/b binding protein 4
MALAPMALAPMALAPMALTPTQASFSAKSMPGITSPLGFFDPLGFSGNDASEGKIKFYREVELKHGRVAMLATVGFVVGEHWHPLWGGSIDVPSYIAFQETPLQTFLPGVALLVAIHEVLSVFTFNSPFGGELWSIRSDYANGDLGWDPLGLKPSDPAALKDMQTKEINNGRAAMIGIVGMISQELATGQKLF